MFTKIVIACVALAGGFAIGYWAIPQDSSSSPTPTPTPLVDPHGDYCSDTVNLAAVQPPSVNHTTLDYNPFTAYPPVKKAGDGGQCKAQYYRITEPLQVWRVFESSKPASALGSWWNLEAPAYMSVANFRHRDDVCASWTPDPDRYHSCYIKAGTDLAIGPGQSANCTNITYAESSEPQVYVNAYGNTSMFADCSAPHAFPVC